jgi:hypothetical protein
MLDARVFAIPRRMLTSGCASSSCKAAGIDPVAGRFAGTGAVNEAPSVTLPL